MPMVRTIPTPMRPRALRAFLFSLRAKSAWNRRSPWRDSPCPSGIHRTNRTIPHPLSQRLAIEPQGLGVGDLEVPMWTAVNRIRHERNGLRCPSDLSDGWIRIAGDQTPARTNNVFTLKITDQAIWSVSRSLKSVKTTQLGANVRDSVALRGVNPRLVRGEPYGRLCPAFNLARDQIFFFTRRRSKAYPTRKISTLKPRRLRSSSLGSAAHIRKAATSLAYC